MKKLLLAAVAVVVLAAGPAVAADLGRKAPAYIPPPAPPPPTFTGCYVDGGVGYGLWNIDHSTLSNGQQSTTETTSGGRGWLPAGWAAAATISSAGAGSGAIGSSARSPITTSWTCTRISVFPTWDLTASPAKRNKRMPGLSADGLAIWSLRMSSLTGMAATLKPALMGSTLAMSF